VARPGKGSAGLAPGWRRHETGAGCRQYRCAMNRAPGQDGDGLTIRLATPADAPAVQAIYAPIVVATPISFELEPPSVEEMAARIAGVLPAYPWLVAEAAGGVAGYDYGRAFQTRAAYSWSVETSVYVAEATRGRGIGRALYRALVDLPRVTGRPWPAACCPTRRASPCTSRSASSAPASSAASAGSSGPGTTSCGGSANSPLPEPGTPPGPRARQSPSTTPRRGGGRCLAPPGAAEVGRTGFLAGGPGRAGVLSCRVGRVATTRPRPKRGEPWAMRCEPRPFL
jgi:L-amino acid N-acyltransferase YncA